MKKPFFKTIVGRIILLIVPSILKKQKFVKTDKDIDRIDNISEILK